MVDTPGKVLALVLAGGKGTRLEPLTSNRSKPAVPFGGQYRIIDFVLSNLINSGIYSIYVLTMFKSQSLNEHLQEAWNFGNILPNHYIIPVPAQQRTGDHWYRGTADAIYQNLNLIEDRDPDEIVIFGGDHIFLMNVNHMLAFARKRNADACVACIPCPIEEAHQFGVIQVDEEWHITGFQEKPKDPTPIPGDPTMALVSMGNYWFNRSSVIDNLLRDAKDPKSSHDFGKNILPHMLASGQSLYAYDFAQNFIPGSNPEANDSYWRDVGTLDAYFDANMDLRAVSPELDLYNLEWPIRTADSHLPPPKFVHNVEGRVGQAIQSIVCSGSIISGATVIDSVIGRQCIINSYAELRACVLMDDVHVGRGAQLHRCIVDKHVRIPAGDRIGFDHVEDAKRFHITENGIVVIAKNQCLEKPQA
ncbi:MAG: glucose-1-phosphate adenylyltransferase [Planctomycetota bacterium]|nr:MAG: glucose-1-phosphate adenylyltransferase [Planctomycetota bacterium]